MESNDKFIADQNEFWAMVPIFTKFSRIHNVLKNDFTELLNIAEQHKNNLSKFNVLCRDSIKGFFSLIEADLFYYNHVDKYEGYDDRDVFFEKFKSTFKQICKTWKREELQNEYFSKNLSLLKEL